MTIPTRHFVALLLLTFALGAGVGALVAVDFVPTIRVQQDTRHLLILTSPKEAKERKP